METRVEVVSKEMIKPSSPTPCELRKFKLSFLDQVAPGCFTPIIFFYPSHQLSDAIADHSQRSSLLRDSLSRILTRFYPLAGTIIDGRSVDCDDQGVEYSEARVSCTLSEMVDEPERNRLLPLLPFQSSAADEPGCGSRQFNLGVRYNIFSCGGIAVAVSVYHKLCDGMSSTTFVKEWAATSRGGTNAVGPNFDAATLFPPTNLLGFRRVELETKNFATKRFVFSKANIAALREEIAASGDSDVILDKPPTRVEAISAFIWKRFIAITRSKQPNLKVVAAIQAVNLRGRMDPPLPAHSLGNLWWYGMATTPIDEDNNYQVLVEKIRKSISTIDSELVKKLQNVEKTLESMNKISLARNSGEIEFCSFTSWIRFPLYEADFGWGKPSWVSSPGRPYKNVVNLMPTATVDGGDGVEAWATFDEEVMASFERDPELLAFTSQ